MAKTTKASKKASTKAPAKKAAKPAPKSAPKKATKPTAKAPAKKVAKAAKPMAKKAAKVATKPVKKPTKPATKPATKAASTKKVPPKQAKPAASKPAASKPAKPVKASIAEGSAPLTELTRADASAPAPRQPAAPEARTSKNQASRDARGGSLRYVADAESDQTRGSVDELDSLEVIETDEDAGDVESAEYDSEDAAAEGDGRDESPAGTDTAEANAMADRDALAAGPEGDEPLLTTEERAARKIEHTPETTRAFAIEVARALADDKCTDLVVLDVRNLSSLSDYIVVGSGTSDRQMHFAIKNVVEMAGTQGHQVARTSSDERKTWLIADFVDVIVHLFEPNTRAHYDIEMLWGDAPRLEWERPDQMSRDRAGLGSN